MMGMTSGLSGIMGGGPSTSGAGGGGGGGGSNGDWFGPMMMAGMLANSVAAGVSKKKGGGDSSAGLMPLLMMMQMGQQNGWFDRKAPVSNNAQGFDANPLYGDGPPASYGQGGQPLSMNNRPYVPQVSGPTPSQGNMFSMR